MDTETCCYSSANERMVKTLGKIHHRNILSQLLQLHEKTKELKALKNAKTLQWVNDI